MHVTNLHSTRLEKLAMQEKRQVFIQKAGELVADLSSGTGKGISENSIWELTTEVIFDQENDEPVFYHICPVVNPSDNSLTYKHILTAYPDEGRLEKKIEFAVRHIGLAVAVDIPVYPNSVQLEAQLAIYYERLLTDGFTVNDSKGKRSHYKLTNSKTISDFSSSGLASIDSSRPWLPIDLALLKKKVLEELEHFNKAKQALFKLTIAIQQLKELLANPGKESSLQSCLRENPILFGLEYSETIPQFKLGSEYVVDFALVKYSGLADLVEIEPSTFNLYSKKGNPSSHLVHAEQQAIDWLDWVEENGAYARKHLNGLISPSIFIIIGRKSRLTAKDQNSLQRRNLLYRGAIQILTYDSLAERAEAILATLTSE